MDSGLPPARRSMPRDPNVFFLVVAMTSAVIVFLGFVPTYWIPAISDAGQLRTLIHIHALLFFGWSVLFVVQTALVWRDHVAAHRRVGVLAGLWSFATIVVGFLLAVSVIGRDLDAIDGSAGSIVTIIPLTQVCLFSCFLTLGIANIKQVESHKRYMTLAALVAVTPAIARLSAAAQGAPSVPVIFLVSNACLVGVAWYDRRRTGSLHPVFLWGGVLILFVRVVRIPVAMTPSWRATAEVLAAWAS